MDNNELRFEFNVRLKKVWHQEKSIETPKEQQMNLQKGLILAYQIQRFIKENKVKSLLELGKWTNMSQARICQIMKLLLLSSDIQKEIIEKNNDRITTLTERTVRRIIFELDWKKQGEAWNTITSRAL